MDFQLLYMYICKYQWQFQLFMWITEDSYFECINQKLARSTQFILLNLSYYWLSPYTYGETKLKIVIQTSIFFLFIREFGSCEKQVNISQQHQISDYPFHLLRRWRSLWERSYYTGKPCEDGRVEKCKV